MRVVNIKAVLAVTRSTAYTLLLCVYSFYRILILVNLCLSIFYFSDNPRISHFSVICDLLITLIFTPVSGAE